jgi:uncharacterized protein YsxB (DUF464 family)
VVYARRSGAIVSLRVRGHAGFAATGQDIVCAAASALVLSAAHGLHRFCGVAPRVFDSTSQFRLDVPGGGSAQAQAVLETAVAGLEAIAASYPGHIKIKQAKLAATGPRPLRAKSKTTRAR